MQKKLHRLIGTAAEHKESLKVAVVMLVATALYELISKTIVPEYHINPYEFLGTWTGLVCVWLSRTTNILCWPWGIVSSALLGVFFSQIGLPGQQWLNWGYFMIIQLWAWPHWAFGGAEKSELPVSRLTWRGRTVTVALIALGTVGIHSLIDVFVPGSAYPWLDALAVTASVIAQYLLGRKKVESWILWLGPVNMVSIALFFMTHAYTLTALYVAFFIHAAIALREWARADKHTSYVQPGIVIGKFYPPHRGHKYLIDTARAQCEQLTVIVCWKKSQNISGVERAQWLQEMHPDVHVKLLDDDRLDPDDSAAWAQQTLEVLGFTPDAVFTSEAYGEPYASFMGCVHVLVDKERTHIPISATMVRGNPTKYAHMLEPVVRASFARRICVLGAESTGTTTLAQDLAKHYKTVWVPEFGRFFSEGKLHGDGNAAWRSEEFVKIARAQCAMEDALAESSNGLVICDTDAFATGVWHERYMGARSAAVEAIATRRSYDLYILTGDEIPFVQDGTRDGEHIRHWMHERFSQRLAEEGKKYIVVRGSKEERVRIATEAIDALTSSWAVHEMQATMVA